VSQWFTGARAGQDPRLADVGPRFAARIIDSVAVAVLVLGVNTAFGITLLDKNNLLTGGAVVAQLVTALLYEVPSTAIFGQTFGKRIMKIRVVRIESGAVPGGGRALLRFSVPLVAQQLPGIIGLLAYMVVQLWFLWDPRRQNIPDKVARTLVVKVGAETPGVIDVG
jgi:uncharacterized RDD family membrane protein YckC